MTTLVNPWGRKTQLNKIANDLAFYICEDLSIEYGLNMPFEIAEELAYGLLEIAEERYRER